jgi:hypothetical protein
MEIISSKIVYNEEFEDTKGPKGQTMIYKTYT